MSKTKLSKDSHLDAMEDLDHETQSLTVIDLSQAVDQINKDPYYVACFEDKHDQDLYYRGVLIHRKTDRPVFYITKENRMERYLFGFDVWMLDPQRLFYYDDVFERAMPIREIDTILSLMMMRSPLLKFVTVGRTPKQRIAEYMWWWLAEYVSSENWTNLIYICHEEISVTNNSRKKRRVEKLPIWTSVKKFSDSLYDETLFKKPLDLLKFIEDRKRAFPNAEPGARSSIPDYAVFDIVNDFSTVRELQTNVLMMLETPRNQFRRISVGKHSSLHASIGIRIGCDQRAYQWHQDAVDAIEKEEWDRDNGL